MTQNYTFCHFDICYLENSKRQRKPVGILLEALNEMNEMKKILSKSDENKNFPSTAKSHFSLPHRPLLHKKTVNATKN